MLKNIDIRNFKLIILVCIVILSIIGYLCVGSIDISLQKKQLVGILAGLFIMCVVMMVDYHNYADKYYWLFYMAAVGLLLLVHFAGKTNQNATRWLEIHGFVFQPSELSKILLIVFFGKFFEKYHEKINNPKILFFSLFLALIPIYLILKQPNLSTSIVTFIIILTQIFVAGLSYRLILPTLTVIIPSIIVFLQILLSKANSGQLPNIYQLKRLVAWLEPNNPQYSSLIDQQNNSVMAIGAGELLGKGLNSNIISSVKNANFVSQSSTDFIFSVIGEEFGFIGCLVTVATFLVLSISIALVAKHAKDYLGSYIATGMMALISFQSFLNIGVATRILPNTGVTLPFVSYGLTSMLSLYIGIGIVLNVGFQPKEY